MKSTTEQQLTDCIEMEYSYLNLFDCHVLNEKPFVRAPQGQVAECGFICSHTNVPESEKTC